MGIFVYQTDTTIKASTFIDSDVDIIVSNIVSVIFRNYVNIGAYLTIEEKYSPHELLFTRTLVGNVLTTKRYYDSAEVASTVKSEFDVIYADNTLHMNDTGSADLFEFNYSIYEITDEEFTTLLLK